MTNYSQMCRVQITKQCNIISLMFDERQALAAIQLTIAY